MTPNESGENVLAELTKINGELAQDEAEGNPWGLTPASEYPQVAGPISAVTKAVIKPVNKVMSKISGGMTDVPVRGMVEKGMNPQGNGPLPLPPIENTPPLPAYKEPLATGVEKPPEPPVPGVRSGRTQSPIDPQAVSDRVHGLTEGASMEPRDPPSRNLNFERINTEDDLAYEAMAHIDAISKELPPMTTQTNKETRAKAMAGYKSELSTVLGKPDENGNWSLPDGTGGAMSAEQLYGVRTMLATQGENVAQLADKIAGGDHSSATLLEYQQQIKATGALTEFLRGETRKIGQALQQFKMIAEVRRTANLDNMDDMLHQGGMTPQMIVFHAKTMKAKIATSGPVTPLKMPWSHSAISTIAEYWKSNILSGVETHAVNMASNLALNVWENLVINPVSAGIGKVRVGMGINAIDPTDRAHFSQTMGAVYGGYSGLRDGLEIAARTLMEDKSIFMTVGKGESQNRMAALADKVPDVMGMGKLARGAAVVETIPFRMLGAEDDFFKALMYSQKMNGDALSMAYREGLDGNAAMTRAAEILNDPPPQMHQAALDRAREVTFTQTDNRGIVGAMGKAMKQLTAAYPILQFITPFINTPVQLVQRAADMSVLATVNPALWKTVKAGGAEGDRALAKISTGAALTGFAYVAYQNDLITGQGPSNMDQRRLLEKSGWKEGSVRVGNKWVSIKRLEPFSGAIGFLANSMDQARFDNGGEMEASIIMKGAAFGIADHAMDGTFLRGMSSFFTMLERMKADPGGQAFEKWMASYASGMIPLSGAQKSVAKFTDPQQRRGSPSGSKYPIPFAQTIQERIQGGQFSDVWGAGRKKSLRPGRHWNGEVALPEQGRLAYSMSPIKVGTIKDMTKSEQELVRLGITGRSKIGEPSPMVSIGKGRYAMHLSLLQIDDYSGEIYDQYYKEVGALREKYMNAVVNHKSYSKLMDSEKKGEIDRVLMRAQADAKNNFVFRILPEMPAAQQDLVAKHLGKNTKQMIRDVRDLRAMQLEGKSLGSEQRELLERTTPQRKETIDTGSLLMRNK